MFNFIVMALEAFFVGLFAVASVIFFLFGRSRCALGKWNSDEESAELLESWKQGRQAERWAMWFTIVAFVPSLSFGSEVMFALSGVLFGFFWWQCVEYKLQDKEH